MHRTVHAERITLDILMNDDLDTSCAKFRGLCEKFVTTFIKKRWRESVRSNNFLAIWGTL